MKDRNIRARVLVKMTVDGKPVAIGDDVLVDADTFRNCVADGRLEASPPEALGTANTSVAASVASAPPSPAVKPKK